MPLQGGLRSFLFCFAAAGALCTALLLCSCGDGSSSTGARPSSGLPPLPPARAGVHFKHIIIMIQENRSFDNLFATLPGADGTTIGEIHDGSSIPLQKSRLDSRMALNNGYQAFLRDLNGGGMNGFDLVPVGSSPGTYAYQYVNPAQIQPYWTLAKQYVLADHMFQTQGSGSFTAHQDLIAGGSFVDANHSLIDFPNSLPWGCDGPSGMVTSLITRDNQYEADRGPFPCLSYRTLRDTLDAAGVTWRYYTPQISTRGGSVWSAFDAISTVRNGPEWGTNVVWPETLVFKDIASDSLPGVAWIVPDFQNSDHPGSNSDSGPSWVAQVIDAIGQSPAWKSTAIVVVWDDWGGWYDHVPPPKPYTFGGLGFRVPMIVVSPYANAGYVTHHRYEFGSIVKFVENNWNLPRLGTTDERAVDFTNDVFDFDRSPRPFVTISSKYSKAFFEHQRPSNKPVDTD